MRLITLIIICLLTNGPLRSQKFTTIPFKDGVLHYKVYGEGIPVLIINGGPGMNSDGFKPLAEKIGETAMAIIYDQRGTGQSLLNEVSEATISMDAMVADIETIRHHLNLDDWVVMGHSFGGMLASYYAAIHPDRVQGLILSSSGGIDMRLFNTLDITARLTPMDRDSLSYWNSKIATGDTTLYARLQRGKYLAPAYVVNKSNIPTIAERLTQGNRIINEMVIRNMRKMNFDCTRQLKNFTCPVLIIRGRQDIIPEEVGNYAHKVFPNSQLVLLDNCGHYGWLDRPQAYLSEITTFLRYIR